MAALEPSIRGALRMAFLLLASALAACAHSGIGHASAWSVDHASSRIGFASTHAGRTFDGTFQRWTADIRFDPENLAGAKAEVVVDLASAVTGDMTYDKTLPTADWFNTAKFAQARFVTSDFRATGGGMFEADGTLELRGNSVLVTLVFSFSQTGETAEIEGTTKLKRLDFDIGRQSDSSGAWVDLDVPVTVKVIMARTP